MEELMLTIVNVKTIAIQFHVLKPVIFPTASMIDQGR